MQILEHKHYQINVVKLVLYFENIKTKECVSNNALNVSTASNCVTEIGGNRKVQNVTRSGRYCEKKMQKKA